MNNSIKTLLLKCTRFEWDNENKKKNCLKHNVSNSECEQIFFNRPFIIHFDGKHSDKEERFYALGHTDLRRKIFIVFTIKDTKIRVLSARDMSQKEKEIYKQL